MKRLRKINRSRKGKRATGPEVRWPAQRDVFVQCRVTTSDLARRCRVPYLRARAVRAGHSIIRVDEANRLPTYVATALREALPIGAAVNGTKTTALRDRHAAAAQLDLLGGAS